MFLIHHGIKGQRWGVRNGPPYPLGEEDKSKSERNSENSGIDSGKMLKIGAKVVGGALIGLAVAQLDPGMIDNLIRTGRAAVKSTVNLSETSAAFSTERFKVLSRPKPIKEALESCNYGAGELLDRSMNCGNTTIAFELQRRGIDVQACPNHYGMTMTHMGRYFSGMTEESFCQPDVLGSFKNLSDSDLFMIRTGFIGPELEKKLRTRGISIRKFVSKALEDAYPDGARGNMFVPSAGGSHFISWEKVKGKIHFFNPQEPKRDLDTLFGTHCDFDMLSARLTAMRLDNLFINSDNIVDAVEPFGLKHDFDRGAFKAYQQYGDGFIAIDQELKDLLV